MQLIGDQKKDISQAAGEIFFLLKVEGSGSTYFMPIWMYVYIILQVNMRFTSSILMIKCFLTKSAWNL